ncbi:DUF742 domain-containing protein [Murinocardiopsis flavida]|nr:DUF742 domain-containing protein [Murinocardiopsis flavida]
MHEPHGPGPEPLDGDPLVRPYVITTGRGSLDTVRLDMISIIVSTRAEIDETTLEPEQVEIIALCRDAKSVAEVAAHLHIPVGVVKVLLRDLIGRGYALARAPITESPVGRDVLQAVIHGIQRL